MKYICVIAMTACFALFPFKNRDLFNDFHDYFAQRDFVKMEKLLSADFASKSSGGSEMNKAAYIQYMAEWNTVFDTKWNVVSVTEKGDKIISEEYDNDMFNDYFFGSPQHYQYTYSFAGNTITRVDVDTIPGSRIKEAIFNERFGQFAAWVRARYPESLRYLGRYDKEAAEAVKYMLTEYIKLKGG